jgi:voltage-gated potassium channel
VADQPRVRLPERAASPVRALGARLAIGVALLAIIVTVVYIDRLGYTDNSDDGTLDLLDCVYYATVTMTTTGYGVIVVTPLRVLFLILLVGTTLEVLASQGRQQWRITQWRRRMQEHVLVIGYGTKGRSAVQTLRDNGTPAEAIVVIDPSPSGVSQAQEDGLVCIVGDGTRREVLMRGAADQAQQIIVTADRDDAAVLITLTARAANPEAFVVVAVREQENVPLVRQSGADAVVTSSESVGRLLGLSTVSPALGAVLEDLLTSGHGLEVVERDVQPDEVGKAPQGCADQVIAVVRGGTVHRFYDPTVTQLARGDRLIVVRSGEDLPWAARPGAS